MIIVLFEKIYILKQSEGENNLLKNILLYYCFQ